MWHPMPLSVIIRCLYMAVILSRPCKLAILRIVETGEFATFDACIFGSIIPTHVSKDRVLPLASQSVQDLYVQLSRAPMLTFILTGEYLAPPIVVSLQRQNRPASCQTGVAR